jgi:hypothetical protein
MLNKIYELWCKLWHNKEYQVGTIYDVFTGEEKDFKIYGCRKCKIFKEVN